MLENVEKMWRKCGENVRKCGETVEREGEAQNPTLHAKFSKNTIDRFSRASRKRFKLL